MKRIFFLYTFVITLFISACSASTPEPIKPTLETAPSNLPALDEDWKINMTHSGGIMGLSRSIEIASDGRYTVIDERSNQTITAELSADEITKLKEQIASAEFTAPDRPDGMGCADCFIYDLEIQRNGEKFGIQLNDISLPDSGFESLVSYLRGLIETALK